MDLNITPAFKLNTSYCGSCSSSHSLGGSTDSSCSPLFASVLGALRFSGPVNALLLAAVPTTIVIVTGQNETEIDREGPNEKG